MNYLEAVAAIEKPFQNSQNAARIEAWVARHMQTAKGPGAGRLPKTIDYMPGETCGKIISYLEKHPDKSVGEISEAIDVTPDAVRNALSSVFIIGRVERRPSKNERSRYIYRLAQ